MGNLDTAGSPHAFALKGVGVANSGANATLSTTNLDFGDQLLNPTSAAQTVTLSNFGNATLNIASITAGMPFQQTDTCPSALLSGASGTISITFSPTATGSVTGRLSVTDNAADSSQWISLQGTGVAGACIPKGQQCRPNASCCAGLSCVLLGNRGFCE